MLADALDKIKAALNEVDVWSGQVEAVEVLVSLVGGDSGHGDEARIMDLIDGLSSSDRKWEVRQALADAIPRLPQQWAYHVIVRLEGDTNPYVRKALLRAKRARNQSSAGEVETIIASIDQAIADATKRLRSKQVGLDEALRLVALEAYNVAIIEFSHELKNNIQRIVGPSNTLRRGGFGSDERRIQRALSSLESGARALANFSDNLTWLAQGRSLSFQKTSVRELMEEVRASVTTELESRPVPLHMRRAPDLQFDAVSERLSRALTNVLRNAVEAAEAFPGPAEVLFEATTTSNDEEIEFAIRDTAAGIAPDERQECFLFGRKSNKGNDHLGMGLYIARKVIEIEHGGSIAIEGVEPHGTVFRIRIPAIQTRRARGGLR